MCLSVSFRPPPPGDKLTRVSFFFYPHPHFPPPILSSSPTFKTEEPLKNLGGGGGKNTLGGHLPGIFSSFCAPPFRAPSEAKKGKLNYADKKVPFDDEGRTGNDQMDEDGFFCRRPITYLEKRERRNKCTVLLYNAKINKRPWNLRKNERKRGNSFGISVRRSGVPRKYSTFRL